MEITVNKSDWHIIATQPQITTGCRNTQKPTAALKKLNLHRQIISNQPVTQDSKIMQNKPNLQIAIMNITKVLTKDYKINHPFSLQPNKPYQTQFPNTGKGRFVVLLAVMFDIVFTVDYLKKGTVTLDFGKGLKCNNIIKEGER